MTNSKKPQDQKTNASAVELDESQLDDVEGGASFPKLGDIEGESFKATKSVKKDSLKLGHADAKSWKVNGLKG